MVSLRWYSAEIIMDADYVDGLALLVNTPVSAESLYHHLELAERGTGLYVNLDKIELMTSKQNRFIFKLNGKPLK